MASSSAPATPPAGSGATGKSSFAQNYAGAVSGMGTANIFQYQPKTTNTSYLTQTSPQDITSAVNGVMQQLLGRNATANEIAQYGAELLAAEQANQGHYSQTLSYSSSTGKPLTAVGQQLTSGVDPTAFLTSIIQGTAEARHYYAVNNYMSGLQELTNQFQGPL